MKRVLAVLAAVPLLCSGTAYASTAHWTMNEKHTSVLRDATGHGYTGTIGRHVVLDGATHRYLPIARGIKQNGRIDVVPDNNRLDPGARSFSVRVRFLWNQNSDNNLIQKGQGSPVGGLFKMKTTVESAGQPPGQLKCLFRGDIGDSQVESYGHHRLDNGKWHVVLCGRNAHGTYMRIDGQPVDHNPKQPGVISNDWPIAIGGNTYCPPDFGYECNYWWGRIGDITWNIV